MHEGYFWVVLAVAFALVSGSLLSNALMVEMRKRRPAGLLRREMQERSGVAEALGRGPVDLLIEYATWATRREELKRSVVSGLMPTLESLSEEQRLLRAAGLVGRVSSEGMKRSRLELAVLSSLVGLAFGVCLSVALSVGMAAAGFLVGWRLLDWALAKRVHERVEDAERHLPEMLDVVSLGLRSGLSFDASLDAYCSHFETLLSKELAAAKDQWTRSLVTREEGLDNVSALFDSPALRRVLGDISRSLRYGSALSGSLEAVATQVRKEYRARKEEEVAKAPVKMMVPTGVLILPAMLILVLGPVMLELMSGF